MHAFDPDNSVFGDGAPRTASRVKLEVQLYDDDDDVVQVLYISLKKARAGFESTESLRESKNKKMAVLPARRVVAVKNTSHSPGDAVAAAKAWIEQRMKGPNQVEDNMWEGWCRRSTGSTVLIARKTRSVAFGGAFCVKRKFG